MIESLFLPPDVSGLIAALAIGLLIGLERGWNDRELPEGSRVAGLRTFTLTGLLGGVLGHLQPNFGPWPLVAAVLGVVSGNGKYSTLRIFTPTSFNDIQHGIFA
ncbi:MgtC/SapB family protein [Acinetobacter sp. NIPH 1852]|uniref:MgtC/SapB family protein n=1 Tax=Acinetobacter sp. NIPH 1852 TaxID=2923428 RepID=UPI003218E8F2